jgi:hypothetical protein
MYLMNLIIARLRMRREATINCHGLKYKVVTIAL